MQTITNALKNTISRFSGPTNEYPILVYQMGKVGSSTLYKSLAKCKLSNPLHHLHLLNNLDEIEQAILKNRPNPTDTLREINKGRELRDKFLSGEFAKLNIITLVRDPVARNVSAFFQNIDEVLPGFSDDPEKSGLDRLKDSFLYDYDHNAPLDWFDSQLRDVFGFDVFEHAFPRETGYAIHQGDRFRLLIFRLDDLDRCVRPAMKEFLGIRRFQLLRSNIGNQKKIGGIYRNFTGNLTLPDSYLDRMYDSKFVRHFYTPEEIGRFRKRWSGPRTGATPAAS